MSKKISYSVENRNTIVLQEDAIKGDYLDLSDVQQIDKSFIEKELSSQLSREIKQTYERQIESLKGELEAKYKAEKIEAVEDANATQRATIERLQDTITELNAKLQNLEALKNSELETALLKKDQTSSLQIKDLENEIRKLHDENKSLKDNINSESIKVRLEEQNKALAEKNSLQEKLARKEAEITMVKAELENITLQKSLKNVKEIGEELETWCDDEYQNYAMNLPNCKWIKDNKVVKNDDEVKGTKADYIFRVYNDSAHSLEIASVCCEMKNETLSAPNKHKNSDHYKKLDEDRNKKECVYALLISELEMKNDNDAPIRKVQEYENMYVVRPQYFMTFLSIINSLTMKYASILTEKEHERLELKDKTEILEEFKHLKETYLDKPLDTMNKGLETILKQSETILKANNTISETASTLITGTITNIKTKIETMDVKMAKLGRKMDKVNN